MNHSTLSARGQALVDSPAMPTYLLEHFQRSERPYHPVDAPDGYIPMCVAENALVWDLFEPKVNGSRGAPHQVMKYADMVGTLEFRTTLARFMSHNILGRKVAPEHLAVLAGAGSVLEILFYVLANPGDGVMVPTPSYAGFWMDLEVRDELNIVTVAGDAEREFRVTPAQLDAAMDASAHPIRALLFTSPNNPIGVVYSREELEEILAWGERRGVHVVFDEVYALSTFGSDAFVSAASLRESLGDHAHVVWAFSKDFAASGLRAGVLVTENEAVMAGVNSLAYWSACSGDTLHLLQTCLADDAWCLTYITTMRTRLAEAHRTVVTALDVASIPYVPSGAAFFVLVDLRAWLSAPTVEAEDVLWRHLLNEANLNLTPGVALRSDQPGWFRLCFASVSPEALAVGMGRLVRGLTR